ncbi:hypothetical protein J1N35_018694 [Gossypium stocksii]|uniref:Retrotransposon gag domain-containing protein n=1 Tax=Gossypium stocksii TaxID=47602 RepID=A0A9D3VQU0_9ROSI|nr:hypothetical protein J1N35_018694 [Gossypium stocksii]
MSHTDENFSINFSSGQIGALGASGQPTEANLFASWFAHWLENLAMQKEGPSVHAKEWQSEMDALRRDVRALHLESQDMLHQVFLGQFRAHKTIISTLKGLMFVKQKEEESLQDYLKCFHVATLNTKNLEDQWAIGAIIMGVQNEHV